jgi:hypothetical protein
VRPAMFRKSRSVRRELAPRGLQVPSLFPLATDTVAQPRLKDGGAKRFYWLSWPRITRRSPKCDAGKELLGERLSCIAG